MITFKAHTKAVHAIAFSPDGGLLATAGHDKFVRAWLKPGDAPSLELDGGEDWSSLAFSPDGRYLAWAGRGAQVWNLDTGGIPLQHSPREHYLHCRFSTDGAAFLLVRRTMQLLTFSVTDWPDLPERLCPWVDFIRAFPAERRGHFRFSVDAHPSIECFAPDGRTRTFLHGPDLCVWETTTNRLLTKRRVSGKHFKDLAFTPDGKRLVTVSNDETVRLWDAATWEQVEGYEWKIGKLGCVAVSPDGMRMAAGGHTGKVVVWDVD